MFIVPRAIQSASSISDVDINIRNQKQDGDLMLGTPLREHLKDHEDELLGTTDLSNCFLLVGSALKILIKQLTTLLAWTCCNCHHKNDQEGN